MNSRLMAVIALVFITGFLGAKARRKSSDMPTWGQVFHQMEGSGPATMKLRVANLTTYLKTLQVK